MAIQLIILTIALVFTGLAAISALAGRPPFAAKSRADLLLTILDGIAVLFVVRLVISWVDLSPLLWLLPVALLALAIGVTVRRWSQWTTWRTTRPVRRSQLFAAVHVLVLVALAAFLTV